MANTRTTRVRLTNGGSVPIAKIAAVGISRDHRVTINDAAGNTMATVKHVSEDDATAEARSIWDQLPHTPRRTQFANGASCLISAIGIVAPTDKHNVLIRNKAGAYLCSFPCDDADEAHRECDRIDALMA